MLHKKSKHAKYQLEVKDSTGSISKLKSAIVYVLSETVDLCFSGG